MINRYSLIVLAGAASYGVLAILVKLAYEADFSVAEVTGSQLIAGWLMLLLLRVLLTRRRSGLNRRRWLLLALCGSTSGITGIVYYASLQTIPASIAVVLLFQFAWIGVLIEAIAERKLPDRYKVLSILILFVGTIFAGDIFSGAAELNTAGVVLGLLSALFYALFIFFSGKIATEADAASRSYIMVTGSLVVVLCVFPPTYVFQSDALSLWMYAIPLGLFGFVLPPLLFAAGMPKIGSGLGSILSTVELPVVIILSAMILREQVVWYQWIGVGLIMAGMAVPELKRGQASEAGQARS